MGYLLRQTRQSYWTGEATVSEERRTYAHAAFSRRDVDVDGVSVFRAETLEQEMLVVAAYACQKKEGPNKLDLLHLTDEEIAPFGIATPDDNGGMAVRSVNALHRVLAWTPETLQAFVDDLLARRRQTKRYSPRTIIDAIARLDPADVEEGPHRDWVLKIQREKK